MFSNATFNATLIRLLVSIPGMLLCLSVHEASHGFAAYALGDPTAKNAGRLTIDPVRHLDVIGTICLLFFHVGWAKPVPVDPRYFKHPRRDMALVSLAGPLSNFVLALVALFLYHPLRMSSSNVVMTIALMLYMTAVMSIGLGVFNLIPVPPLDGSKILFSFLPYRIERKVTQYQQFIQFGLFVLLFIGVLDVPMNAAINLVYRALYTVVLMVLG